MPLDICMRFMRICQNSPVSLDNYQTILTKILQDNADYFKYIEATHDWNKYQLKEINPCWIDSFNVESSWSAMERVHVLHALAELALYIQPARITRRTDTDDLEELEHLRVEPVGYDDDGSAYFLFDDNRLYRINGDDCECVCNGTLSEWKALEPKLQDKLQNQELLQLLNIEYVPSVISHINEILKAKHQEYIKTLVREPRSLRQSSRQKKSQSVEQYITEEEEALSKMSARERRQKEREDKLLQEQLAQIAKAEKEQAKQEAQLKKLQQQPVLKPLKIKVKQKELWYFDCYCGIIAPNYDDGTVLIECNTCHVWKHLKCVNQKQPKHPGVTSWSQVPVYNCHFCSDHDSTQESGFDLL